jgi:hypothetical protein
MHADIFNAKTLDFTGWFLSLISCVFVSFENIVGKKINATSK